MPFNTQQMPLRKRARVVAVFLRGHGDGSAEAEGPVVTMATRDYGGVNSGYGRFEVSTTDLVENSGGLAVEFRENTNLNYMQGTGWVNGVLILGMLGRKETDEAGLARLAVDVPDVRTAWANHCDKFRSDSRDIEAALRRGLDNGFGTGLPIRFG